MEKNSSSEDWVKVEVGKPREDASITSTSASFSSWSQVAAESPLGDAASISGYPFDFLSRAVGEIVMVCKICNHYNRTTRHRCELCGIEFVPESVNIDEVLAHYLQQREVIQAHSRRDKRRVKPRVNYKSCYSYRTNTLTDQLQSLLCKYKAPNGRKPVAPSKQIPLVPIPVKHLRRHVNRFLSAEIPEVIALQYKAVKRVYPKQIWKAVKANGFAFDSSVGFDDPVQVCSTISGAIRLAKYGKKQPHLPAISEGLEDDENAPSDYIVWLVATSDDKGVCRDTPFGAVSRIRYRIPRPRFQ